MRFIAEKTSIPVPKVYWSFVHRERAYIVMERIQGEVLPAVWDALSDEARRELLLQLKGIIRQLHAIEAPVDVGVQSCAGGSLYDSRIMRPGVIRFGPFKSVQEFHLWLRNDLHPSEVKEQDRTVSQPVWQELESMAALQDGAWPSPVFTHADLNPFNILVHSLEHKIVGIIDWEFAGCYSSYWEYTSAWHGNFTGTYWRDMIEQFLVPDLDALEMERVCQRWYGEV